MPPKSRAEKDTKLTEKIEKLEKLIAKLCHMSGQERLLTEFDIEKWKPGTQDMTRWAKD